MRTLYIIRGLPGSGKSTLGSMLTQWNVSNDEYFTDKEGNYNFVASKLPEAFKYCENVTRSAMRQGVSVIAVCNTFVKREHMQVYLDMAKEHCYSVNIIVCTGNFGSVHNVPDYVMDRMRAQWEH